MEVQLAKEEGNLGKDGLTTEKRYKTGTKGDGKLRMSKTTVLDSKGISTDHQSALAK